MRPAITSQGEYPGSWRHACRTAAHLSSGKELDNGHSMSRSRRDPRRTAGRRQPNGKEVSLARRGKKEKLKMTQNDTVGIRKVIQS